MTELVFLQNRQALTTSLKVAEYFEKQHMHVMRDIRDLIAQIGDISKSGLMFRKATYVDTYGRQQNMYNMNRDGFTLLAMGFTGKKALQFKLDYIQAFNQMEQFLLNQQNEQWRAIRKSGKVGNKEMCDVIHDYIIPLARANGSTTPDVRFYQNYQKAVNKAAGITPNSRDELPLGQLYEVEKLQAITQVSIRGLAARGKDYKEIYRDTKQTLENYSRLSLIAERFLPA